MKRLTVLVDMDDVLCNTLETLILFLNTKYGTEVRLEDATEWELGNLFPALSSKQIYEPLTTQAFWDCVNPTPEARTYIERIQNEGNDVYVLTASHPSTIRMKYESVLKHFFPSLEWKNVIVCSSKHLVHGDVLIDDYINNLNKSVGCNILFEMPHNKDKSRNDVCFKRASKWSDVYDIVHELQHNGGK